MTLPVVWEVRECDDPSFEAVVGVLVIVAIVGTRRVGGSDVELVVGPAGITHERADF